MKIILRITSTLLLLLSISALSALAQKNPGAGGPPVGAAGQTVGPVPDSQISPEIRKAIDAPDRPQDDKMLDAGRQPAQLMQFFGIKPGMKVADLSAGGGYTTEILSRIVGSKGH